MIVPHETPIGDPTREAINSLGGYVYQIYQSALAWIDLKHNEFLYLEVAEDFAVLANNALKAVQVKKTFTPVTINSQEIITSIDSYIEIKVKNPNLEIILHHLTTSNIGKEKNKNDRIGNVPTLEMWRILAESGDLFEFRRIIDKSKLSENSKKYIESLNDLEFRDKLLKKIYFDCGALDFGLLERQVTSKVITLLMKRGGMDSQAEGCTANILLHVLKLSIKDDRNERYVKRTDLEKILESATHIPVNRAHFEKYTHLLMLLAEKTSLKISNSFTPIKISRIPLPKALANRKEEVERLLYSLKHNSFCWISGAPGMGKSMTSRVLANKHDGDWAYVDLKGLNHIQISSTLFEIASEILSLGFHGLILEDLDNASIPLILDNLCFLIHSAKNFDICLVITSLHPPTSEFLFSSNLPSSINANLTEFTEKDIEEILEKLGVNDIRWVKYIHLVSGGGHPHIAIAFIQSMIASGWNLQELESLNSLITQAPAISEIRKRTRERLLKDLPDTTRRLIERLSIKVGGFSRELAIDLAKLSPPIQDAGILLDGLIGSWVNQYDEDRFLLSQLISNYGTATLAIHDRNLIQSAIAYSLTKGPIIDALDIDSALLAAWNTDEKVLLKILMVMLKIEQDKLGVLASHLLMFKTIGTKEVAYPKHAGISLMFRGVQVLISNQSNNSQLLNDSLNCFYEESKKAPDKNWSALINFLVYSKLLMHTSKAGLGINFISIIQELDQLLQNSNSLIPDEVFKEFENSLVTGMIPIGIIFVNQIHQISKIEDLLTVFNFLDSISPETRSRMLKPFDVKDYDVDILVSGAWLGEYRNNTIDSNLHSAIFASLEEKAIRWQRTDIAVSCRKFQAIILDEYGNDKILALALLEEGRTNYGQNNVELIRAQAKILYRSNDHVGNLALSKIIIENDTPLNESDAVFFRRDAAISAEKIGDFKTARQYYLHASDSAKKSNLQVMKAIGVGLLADAAISSWHDADRLTCLKEFVLILNELNNIAPENSLQTAHCHAIILHVLLWLAQDATAEINKLSDEESTSIYAGMASNPNPHPDIASQHITSIDMLWYMLASVENYAALDVGITENLLKSLPKGPVREGHMFLTWAKMHKAFITLNIKTFSNALKDQVSFSAFIQKSGEKSEALDFKNVTYDIFPSATLEQQEKLNNLIEQFTLLYFAMCILKEDMKSMEAAFIELSTSTDFSIRPVLFNCLKNIALAEDYNTDFALLINVHAKHTEGVLKVHPRQVFELAIRVLKIAEQTRYYQIFSEMVLRWFINRWQFIWEHQRFLLINPFLHESSIKNVIDQDHVLAQIKIINILLAVLPTLRIINEKELEMLIRNLPNK